MYLHLGQDIIVKTEDVLGIFDLDNCTVSKITRDYLARAEQQGRVVNVSMELPKTFVVCASPKKADGVTVYISQISAATLRKRTNFFRTVAL
ncbi:MAG: DUF370 domain-containing protein [Oscillospiraceae bacterium]|nr:DUF370 domain-containing protein [Oscillospiraceae bacterium]